MKRPLQLTISIYLLFASFAYASPSNLGIFTENIRGVPLHFLDNGETLVTTNPQRIATLKKITETANNLSGIPYATGGMTPETGFDCSGFVRYVFSHAANISLPKNARQIARISIAVKKDALQPGDLLFFNTLKLPFTHVGIYMGNQQFIHAPSTGSVVRLDDLESTYWAQHFNGAKRIAVD